MNLKQALDLSKLGQAAKSQPVMQKRSAEEVAKRVFELAAQAGRPFENQTHKDWAKRWLASKEFVLMEIPLGKAALPMRPKNENLVLRNVTASAHEEPIVVDTNKRGIGAAYVGYTPDVIVVDGKHRHVAYTLQGRGRCMAWVGVKAVKSVQEKNPKLDIAASSTKSTTKIEAAAILATSVPAQSDSINNSANHMPMPGTKPDGKVFAGGPGSGCHGPNCGRHTYKGNVGNTKTGVSTHTWEGRNSLGTKSRVDFEHHPVRFDDYDKNKIAVHRKFVVKENGQTQHVSDSHSKALKYLKDNYGIVPDWQQGGIHPSRIKGAGAPASLGQGSGANPERMGFAGVKIDKMLVDKKKKVEAGGPGSGRRPGYGMYLDPNQTRVVSKGNHLGVDYEVHHNPGYAGENKYGNNHDQISYRTAKQAERGAKERIARMKSFGAGAELNDPSDELNDPSDKSPGSGNGKRTKPSYGGSKSELNMKLKGAKK